MCQEEHAALLGEAARRISEQWKSEVEVSPVPGICRPKSNFLSVTDADLVHLKGLAKLTNLILPYHTQVTDAGVAELKKAAHHGADEPGLGLASPKRDDSPPLVFARCKGCGTLYPHPGRRPNCPHQ